MDNLPVIAIRFALYTDLMVLAGMVAFSVYALTASERLSASLLPLRKVALILPVLGLILSAWGMVALTASMMGTSQFAVDPAMLRMMVTETAIGTAWIVRMAALLVAVFFSLILDRAPLIARIGLVLAASIAISSLVWTGHAGATEGFAGTIHRVSDIVHMLAAAIWIGGIACFIRLLFVPLEQQDRAHVSITHRALDQFSGVGTLVVGLLVLTGLINSQFIFGLPNLGQLFTTFYGWLLIAKLLLFAVMLGLAADNRWRLAPTLSGDLETRGTAQTVKALRKSLIIEASAVLLILAAVAWLGTLEPIPSSNLTNSLDHDMM